MADPKAQNSFAEFGDLLRDATAQGLKRSLGESATRAILFHLHIENYDDPDELHSKLVGLLSRGAIALESVVLSELSAKMGEELQHKDDDFMQCVLRAKARYNKRIGRE